MKVGWRDGQMQSELKSVSLSPHTFPTNIGHGLKNKSAGENKDKRQLQQSADKVPDK